MSFRYSTLLDFIEIYFFLEPNLHDNYKLPDEANIYLVILAPSIFDYLAQINDNINVITYFPLNPSTFKIFPKCTHHNPYHLVVLLITKQS